MNDVFVLVFCCLSFCNSWPLNPSLLSDFIIILLITNMDMDGQAMAMAMAMASALASHG